MTATAAARTPIALRRDEGEALWFLDSLGTIKASAGATQGRMALVEFLAPKGSASPLHVHHNEDEWFYVLEGELTFWVGGQVVEASAGSFVYGPRDVPHTFIVNSAEARFLIGAEPAGFENFIRALGQPAESLTLPPPSFQPPDPERMATTAAEYGMEILGPPGIPS